MAANIQARLFYGIFTSGNASYQSGLCVFISDFKLTIGTHVLLVLDFYHFSHISQEVHFYSFGHFSLSWVY